MARIVSIGECMLELAAAAGQWRLGAGGDSFNTALYLTRLGHPATYLTALGDDPFSAEMRAAWRDEGIVDDLVLTVPGRLPGLYAIRTDGAGERSFFYWRDRSAARALFDAKGIDAALAEAGRARLLYLSGITLSLFDDAGRARLISLCAAVRANGGDVAFDPNYRPKGWPGAEAARSAIAAIAPKVTIALPTLDDEQRLYPGDGLEAVFRRWSAAELVVKIGAEGAAIRDGDFRTIKPAAQIAARDTTGAGDAFNAGYLACRLRGLARDEAVAFANRLAGEVVRHPGAIIPLGAMPEF